MIHVQNIVNYAPTEQCGYCELMFGLPFTLFACICIFRRAAGLWVRNSWLDYSDSWSGRHL